MNHMLKLFSNSNNNNGIKNQSGSTKSFICKYKASQSQVTSVPCNPWLKLLSAYPTEAQLRRVDP